MKYTPNYKLAGRFAPNAKQQKDDTGKALAIVAVLAVMAIIVVVVALVVYVSTNSLDSAVTPTATAESTVAQSTYQDETETPSPIKTTQASEEKHETSTETTEPQTSATPASPTCSTVDTESLNLREGPGVEYDVTGWLNYGDGVCWNRKNGDWLELDTGGWVNGQYVKGTP